MSTELTGIVAEHIAAVNAFDTDAIVATFADDAYVNDVHREIAGIDAIRGWAAKELVDDKVTLDVQEVVDHHGDIVVRAAYDGKSWGKLSPANSPPPLLIDSMKIAS